MGIRATSSVSDAGASGRMKIRPMFPQLPVPVAAIIIGFITFPMKGRVPRVTMKIAKAPAHLRSCHRSQRSLLRVAVGRSVGMVYCSERSVAG